MESKRKYQEVSYSEDLMAKVKKVSASTFEYHHKCFKMLL